MLKKSARGVRASLPAAVKRETRVSRGAADLPEERRVSARWGCAGETSGLFDHPAWRIPVITDVQTGEIQACPQSFSAAY